MRYDHVGAVDAARRGVQASASLCRRNSLLGQPRRCFTRTTTLTWLRAVAVVAIAPAHTSEWPLWLPHGTTRQTTRGAEKSE